MATEGDYFERYQKWKAAKEAEMAARGKKPLAVANTNVTAVQTPARTAPAAKPMLVEKPVAPPQTPKAVPAVNLPAPPSATQAQTQAQQAASREEQLKAWREERERLGLVTPSRLAKKAAPVSPRSLNIKGQPQRQALPPGTPQVVKPHENKQNTLIADTRALAVHAASQGRPAEGRLLLLQLRQADPSVVHNPYWWIARARLEEEVQNKTEVIQLFEQALKECHTSSYAMLEDGLRSFMMRQITAGGEQALTVPDEDDEADTEAQAAAAEAAQKEHEAVGKAEEEELDEIDALLASPSVGSSPDVYVAGRGDGIVVDLSKAFEAMSVKREEGEQQVGSGIQSIEISIKQEKSDVDPEIGLGHAAPRDAVKIAAAMIAEARHQQPAAQEVTSSSSASTTDWTTGSVIAYEAVKVSKKEREALGTERAMTPVRRSARTGSGLDEKKSFKEALIAADYAFAPNAALAPRQEHAKHDAIVISDDNSSASEAIAEPAEIVVKKEEAEPKGKGELLGRFDTYAHSVAGTRLVSRVASPATAAKTVAITPVRRSRRLPNSALAPTTPTDAVVVPNPLVAPASASSKSAKKGRRGAK